MEGFVWDLGTPQERVATPAEARQLLAEMERVFTHDCAHLLYQHKASTARLAAHAAVPAALDKHRQQIESAPAVHCRPAEAASAAHQWPVRSMFHVSTAARQMRLAVNNC